MCKITLNLLLFIGYFLSKRHIVCNYFICERMIVVNEDTTATYSHDCCNNPIDIDTQARLRHNFLLLKCAHWNELDELDIFFSERLVRIKFYAKFAFGLFVY